MRDGWMAGLACVLLGIGVGAVATTLQSTTYRSEGHLLVSPARGFLDPANADQLPGITQTIARLAGTPDVLSAVGRSFAASASDPATDVARTQTATLDWLRSHVAIGQDANTSILNIDGSAPQQSTATDLTQAAVLSLQHFINSPPIAAGGPRVTRPVHPPTTGVVGLALGSIDTQGKVSPTPRRNLLIGLNVGIIVGIVAAIALGSSRRRLRRPRQLAEELGVPLLGVVRTGRARVGHAGYAEARARLQALAPPEPAEVLLLTGICSTQLIAEVAEGLVRAMLSARLRTVLVDADLAQAATSRRQDILDLPGLAESLDGEVREPQLATIAAGREEEEGTPTLRVLPSGGPISDPAARLGRARLSERFDALRVDNDFVVVAGPGLDRQAEVISLLRAVDHVALVTESGVKADRLERAHLLGSTLGARLAGIIVVQRRLGR
jgi:capsular polysaccharide biosynthesis protein